MKIPQRRSSKAIQNNDSTWSQARHVASKRLGRPLEEDENLRIEALNKMLKLKRSGQKNSQARDRAEFAVERNIAAGRRLPRGQSNSI